LFEKDLGYVPEVLFVGQVGWLLALWQCGLFLPDGVAKE
jgi:hypothetical protein